MKFAKSEECMKSELDLFAIPPTQASVDNAVWISKDATSGVPSVDGSLTFKIEKMNDQYLDLSETFIDLTVSLVKLDTKNSMAGDVELGVINNLAHSMFSQVQVKFGGVVVENSNGLYGYKAYIQNLTNYTASEKNSLLYNEMYIEDRPEFFETTKLTNPKTKFTIASNEFEWQQPEDQTNPGFIQRRKRFFNGNKTVQLVGKLKLDLATCPRYFPNHLEVEIELTRAKSPFYLMGAKANANLYAINITGANIQYRAVTINPTVGLAHVTALEKVNAIYPYKEVKVKSTPIPATSNKLTISNIHNGVLPNLMYIGFVDSRAFAGTTEFNAFNFRHFGLTDLLVTCGTNIIPYQKTLSFDFANKNYALAHNTLTQTNQQTEIHYEDYPNGNALFGFNFTPDLCTVNNFNIQKTGNIEVALQFAEQLPQAIHAIFYLEFDNVLEITDKRVAIVNNI